VITDRELDAQLAGAAAVRDADLPALPEDFLEYLMGHAATGAPTALADGEPASVIAARQLVSDARDARTATGRRRRRPGRKALLRVGMAVVAVAAAWLTAVVVAPSDGGGTPDERIATPSEGSPTADPVDGISLVAAEEVTFPLSFDPEPQGLTPYFSRFGGVAPHEDHPLVFTADYHDADGNGFTLWLHSVDPRGLDDYFQPERPGDHDITETGTVSIDGSAAEFARGAFDTGSSFANLRWERPDGRWVQILGDGSYAETSAVVAVAESLVDRPRPLGLQFGLAPAGWSLSGYEESRSIDLTRDDDSGQLLRLSVIPRGGGATLDSVFDDGAPTAGPVATVTVQGQEARLVLKDGGEGNPDFWYLVGQIPDGPLFLMLAADTLTEQQVVEIADQVTYTP
jgi:hypothetical protein